jgi:Zn-finger nucleic acid-binding protein
MEPSFRPTVFPRIRCDVGPQRERLVLIPVGLIGTLSSLFIILLPVSGGPPMTSAAGMPCPVCRVSLVMSERQGVEIDYCPQCRGVWLDRGELDKILERSAQDAPAAAPVQQPSFSRPQYDQGHDRGYAQRYGHGHQHGHPKRKKSFLEELFD